MWIWLMAMIRPSAAMVVAPIFGAANVPVQIRVILAFMIGMVAANSVGFKLPADTAISLGNILFVMGEVVTGLAIGFALQLGYSSVLIAGETISNAMGLNSQTHGPGGQILLQVVDEDWRPVPGLRDALFALVDAIAARPDHALALSIDLAGMLVFAGNEAGLAALLAEAPPTPGRDPLRLAGHGPFHTPLMFGSADKARAELSPTLFGAPAIPLVDGRGHIWRRFASDLAAVWDYTFGHQILAPYDFARSVQVAVKEYAPDTLILPGPGDTLGGAIAQALISIEWQGIRSKADFAARQAADPILLSMGRAEQRALVTGRE